VDTVASRDLAAERTFRFPHEALIFFSPSPILGGRPSETGLLMEAFPHRIDFIITRPSEFTWSLPFLVLVGTFPDLFTGLKLLTPYF